MSEDIWDLSELEFPSYEECPASPETPKVGLRIATPPQVVAREPLHLCGSWRFTSRYLATLPCELVDGVAVVIVDVDRRRSFSCTLASELAAVVHEPGDPSEFHPNQNEVGHFNVDLRESCEELSLLPGEYLAYAVRPPYVSNTVSFNVAKRSS